TAFAACHADRRISLREIALSHKRVSPEAGESPCGKALIAQRLGRSRSTQPKLTTQPSLHVMQIGAFRCAK
ncbi:MAG: hypothetical protein JJU22_14750, partial [Gammaproteobacteria bacterium]|nr:hypothetical protein [Gammaproteobacteria bacterium]